MRETVLILGMALAFGLTSCSWERPFEEPDVSPPIVIDTTVEVDTIVVVIPQLE